MPPAAAASARTAVGATGSARLRRARGHSTAFSQFSSRYCCCLLELLLGQEHGRALGRRQFRRRLLVGGSRRDHGLEPDRPREPLQPDVLALVGIQELLPEPRRGRVRRVLVDRLHVEGADDGVVGHDGLPVPLALERGALPDVQVLPVDHHRGLAGRDRRRRRVDREEVPGSLQLAEELDARRDVVGRAAVRERRHHHPVEPGRRLGRIAVQRDLAAELRLKQIGYAGHGRHGMPASYPIDM